MTSHPTSFDFPEDEVPQQLGNRKGLGSGSLNNEHCHAASSSSPIPPISPIPPLPNRPSSEATATSTFISPTRQRRMLQEEKARNRFVSGDDLHRLRQHIWNVRHQLATARKLASSSSSYSSSTSSSASSSLAAAAWAVHKRSVRTLERAILRALHRDPEYIYQVSLERQLAAQRSGRVRAAAHFEREAQLARSMLPQFQLHGLWVGQFPHHPPHPNKQQQNHEDPINAESTTTSSSTSSFELLNVTYQGDVLVATKITPGKHVGKGEVSFAVDLTPHTHQSQMSGSTGSSSGSTSSSTKNHHHLLDPIELESAAAAQWGARFLSRFAGKGQVAALNGRHNQWLDGQLILVSPHYFSFAWMPIGHQVFFGRPSPEWTLKLLRESSSCSSSSSSQHPHLSSDHFARKFCEQCWEETEHIEDELEVSNGIFTTTGSSLDETRGCFD